MRGVKRFLDWLALSHGNLYPTELHNYTGYLQARQCAQKKSQESLTAQARIKVTTLYFWFFANSIPGRPVKQAPGMFISMLAALEELTVNDRVYAWWILFQSWGTMRFSDHRVLEPSDIRVTSSMTCAKLTTSKNDRR